VDVDVGVGVMTGVDGDAVLGVGTAGLGVPVGAGVAVGDGVAWAAVVRTQRLVDASQRTSPAGHFVPVLRTTSPLRGVSKAASTPTVVDEAERACCAVRDSSGDRRWNSDVVIRTGVAIAEFTRTAAADPPGCFVFRTTIWAGLRSSATALPPLMPSMTMSVESRVPSEPAAQIEPTLREMPVKVAAATL